MILDTKTITKILQKIATNFSVIYATIENLKGTTKKIISTNIFLFLLKDRNIHAMLKALH